MQNVSYIGDWKNNDLNKQQLVILIPASLSPHLLEPLIPLARTIRFQTWLADKISHLIALSILPNVLKDCIKIIDEASYDFKALPNLFS